MLSLREEIKSKDWDRELLTAILSKCADSIEKRWRKDNDFPAEDCICGYGHGWIAELFYSLGRKPPKELVVVGVREVYGRSIEAQKRVAMRFGAWLQERDDQIKAHGGHELTSDGAILYLLTGKLQWRALDPIIADLKLAGLDSVICRIPSIVSPTVVRQFGTFPLGKVPSWSRKVRVMVQDTETGEVLSSEDTTIEAVWTSIECTDYEDGYANVAEELAAESEL